MKVLFCNHSCLVMKSTWTVITLRSPQDRNARFDTALYKIIGDNYEKWVNSPPTLPHCVIIQRRTEKKRPVLTLCLLGDTSEHQLPWWNLSIPQPWAYPVSTILRTFPHTTDNSTIHIRTYPQLNLHSDLQLILRDKLWDTLQYSETTIVVVFTYLFYL